MTVPIPILITLVIFNFIAAVILGTIPFIISVYRDNKNKQSSHELELKFSKELAEETRKFNQQIQEYLENKNNTLQSEKIKLEQEIRVIEEKLLSLIRS